MLTLQALIILGFVYRARIYIYIMCDFLYSRSVFVRSLRITFSGLHMSEVFKVFWCESVDQYIKIRQHLNEYQTSN